MPRVRVIPPRRQRLQRVLTLIPRIHHPRRPGSPYSPSKRKQRKQRTKAAAAASPLAGARTATRAGSSSNENAGGASASMHGRTAKDETGVERSVGGRRRGGDLQGILRRELHHHARHVLVRRLRGLEHAPTAGKGVVSVPLYPTFTHSHTTPTSQSPLHFPRRKSSALPPPLPLALPVAFGVRRERTRRSKHRRRAGSAVRAQARAAWYPLTLGEPASPDDDEELAEEYELADEVVVVYERVVRTPAAARIAVPRRMQRRERVLPSVRMRRRVVRPRAVAAAALRFLPAGALAASLSCSLSLSAVVPSTPFRPIHAYRKGAPRDGLHALIPLHTPQRAQAHPAPLLPFPPLPAFPPLAFSLLRLPRQPPYRIVRSGGV
ncbi:hypothetical protein B0H16DRAFT_1464218 [Mycena metata]|uniref:Uncharacterized protein n=1 Tax=Mycena metata TaxID=1033252 RepID=A0AAD7N2X6_9AGAR|nr:hypothetical protein B0H16DRAFT_1464218 [Mycena metata]